MTESRHANFGAIRAIFLQLSWSKHKLAHSCQGRGQRSNGAINRNKHFARRFCRGISNLVTASNSGRVIPKRNLGNKERNNERERERARERAREREREREVRNTV